MQTGLKYFIFSFLMSAFHVLPAQKSINTYLRKDLYVRDPFIVTDPQTNTYYLYKAERVKNPNGKDANGVVTCERPIV